MLSAHLPHKAPDFPPGAECAGSVGLQFVVTVALQGGKVAKYRPTLLLRLLEVVMISNSAIKSKGRFWKQLWFSSGLVRFLTELAKTVETDTSFAEQPSAMLLGEAAHDDGVSLLNKLNSSCKQVPCADARGAMMAVASSARENKTTTFDTACRRALQMVVRIS